MPTNHSPSQHYYAICRYYSSGRDRSVASSIGIRYPKAPHWHHTQARTVSLNFFSDSDWTSPFLFISECQPIKAHLNTITQYADTTVVAAIAQWPAQSGIRYPKGAHHWYSPVQDSTQYRSWVSFWVIILFYGQYRPLYGSVWIRYSLFESTHSYFFASKP